MSRVGSYSYSACVFVIGSSALQIDATDIVSVIGKLGCGRRGGRGDRQSDGAEVGSGMIAIPVFSAIR